MFQLQSFQEENQQRKGDGEREMEKGGRQSMELSLESEMKYPLDSVKVLLHNYIVPWCSFLQ